MEPVTTFPRVALDRYVIINPSTLDGIQGSSANAIEAEVCFRLRAPGNVSTDRQETILQLGLLRWGQAKLNAN